MLCARNLNKYYGSHQALNNLNLQLAKGEIFALLGQNGAGKSTTINIFLGFIQPDSGEALINGWSVAEKIAEIRQIIAYIPENVMLYPNLTGIENLQFFSSLAGFRYTRQELEDFLHKAGLPIQAQNRPLHGYSKGMRQKVGIAIAIAKRAKLLLMDEPTSGLDPKASNEFSLILKELSQEGCTIFMATHDLFRAKEVAHRIGIMNSGTLKTEIVAQNITAIELEELYLQSAV